MDEPTQKEVLPSQDTAPESADAAQQETLVASASRREFLCKSAKKFAYVAPLVLLFHPKPACASNGSTLTYWDGVAGETKHRTYDQI